jgi:release factor glutamine methyltransferase
MPDEISQHEPREAFDGGSFGITVIMALLKNGPTLLKPGSWLGFELGLGQGEAIKKKAERTGAFKTILDCRDQNEQIRALIGLTHS